jgi:hypothetical protein
LTPLHIVVGYGRGPDAGLPRGGRIRRCRRCTSWWSWPCARYWISASIWRAPDEQGRTLADALLAFCRGDRRWEVSNSRQRGRGIFTERGRKEWAQRVLQAAGMAGLGEKNTAFWQEHSPNCDFLILRSPSTLSTYKNI